MTARRMRKMKDPSVRGHCPMGCGESLFLGEGGYVTCGDLECADPEAVTKLIERRPETGHITVFEDDDTFTIEHPIRERLTGSLFDCPLQAYLVGLTGPPVRSGRYRVTPAAQGWRFEKMTDTEN